MRKTLHTLLIVFISTLSANAQFQYSQFFDGGPYWQRPDCKEGFRLYEDGFFKNKVIYSRHPNILKSVIMSN